MTDQTTTHCDGCYEIAEVEDHSTARHGLDDRPLVFCKPCLVHVNGGPSRREQFIAAQRREDALDEAYERYHQDQRDREDEMDVERWGPEIPQDPEDLQAELEMRAP